MLNVCQCNELTDIRLTRISGNGFLFKWFPQRGQLFRLRTSNYLTPANVDICVQVGTMDRPACRVQETRKQGTIIFSKFNLHSDADSSDLWTSVQFDPP
jgi:hypothetical protein